MLPYHAPGSNVTPFPGGLSSTGIRPSGLRLEDLEIDRQGSRTSSKRCRCCVQSPRIFPSRFDRAVVSRIGCGEMARRGPPKRVSRSCSRRSTWRAQPFDIASSSERRVARSQCSMNGSRTSCPGRGPQSPISISATRTGDRCSTSSKDPGCSSEPTSIQPSPSSRSVGTRKPIPSLPGSPTCSVGFSSTGTGSSARIHWLALLRRHGAGPRVAPLLSRVKFWRPLSDSRAKMASRARL